MWPHDTANGGAAPVAYRCWTLTVAPPTFDADETDELLSGHFRSRSDAVEAYLTLAPEPESWPTLLVLAAAAHAVLAPASLQCWSVSCTHCEQDLVDPDAEFTIHYPDGASADADAARVGWARLPGGGRLCPDCQDRMRWGELLDALHPDTDPDRWLHPVGDAATSRWPSVGQLALDGLGGVR